MYEQSSRRFIDVSDTLKAERSIENLDGAIKQLSNDTKILKDTLERTEQSKDSSRKTLRWPGWGVVLNRSMTFASWSIAY